MKLRKLLAVAIATATAVSALAVSAFANNAYFSFQTGTYCFRNSFDDASYGKATKYYDSFIVWGDDATNPDTFGDDYADMFDYDINGYVLPATYTDATIDKDGTYKIGGTDINFAIKNDTSLNLLVISTDLPIDTAAKITDAKIIVDGEVTATIAEPIAETTGDYLKVNLINIWNTDVAAYAGAYPTKSLEIEFTVSGLGDGAAAGSTDAAGTADKGNADTGVEGVAAVAGLAIVAAGAIVVAKKRK